MTVESFLNGCKGMDGYIIVALTDEYIVDKWSDTEILLTEKQMGKVLEIRVFSKYEEHKLFRPDIGKAFTERIIIDTESGTVLMVNGEQIDLSSNADNDKQSLRWECMGDEIQFLDINMAKGRNENAVFSTSGGAYNLPLEKSQDAKIKIRYYLDRYPDTGQARVADWRIVELMEGK